MKPYKLPNGETINIIDKTTTDWVYKEIYEENEYLKFGVEVKDGDTIFDVGGNIGLFTRFISTQASNLKIFTFEPVPQIFKVLESNVKDLPAEITNYNVGLGEENGSFEVNYYPRASGDSTAVPFKMDEKIDSFVENYKELICKEMPIAKIVPKFLRRRVVKAGLKAAYKGEKVTCYLRTISDIIKENNIDIIDLLKIDAENYEKWVIAGISEEDWPKIQQISMEVHEHIEGGENLMNEMIELLESKGFKTYRGIIGPPNYDSLMGVYMLYAKR